ncbi:MAG: hypothetical protein FIB08_12770 [Candidatus Methanoperedens sp.]|nr:hypothetical protein [Candidatus Methanoperedens sp.]
MLIKLLQEERIDGVSEYPFITNDKKAKRFAKKNNVIAWDIPDIMKAMRKTGIRSKEEKILK